MKEYENQVTRIDFNNTTRARMLSKSLTYVLLHVENFLSKGQFLALLYLGRQLYRLIDALTEFVITVVIACVVAVAAFDPDGPLKGQRRLRDLFHPHVVHTQCVLENHFAVAPAFLAQPLRDGIVALLQIQPSHGRNVGPHHVGLAPPDQYSVVADLRGEHLWLPCVAAQNVRVGGRIRGHDRVQIEIVEPQRIVPQDQNVVVGGAAALFVVQEFGAPQ
mmetsp:Transcript_18886/g.52749  ORF Transcript_18886/g.52749 Transcript_18886/m.52749 type:complete len:219 (-) Transcript_18886:1113-1769(-)